MTEDFIIAHTNVKNLCPHLPQHCPDEDLNSTSTGFLRVKNKGFFYFIFKPTAFSPGGKHVEGEALLATSFQESTILCPYCHGQNTLFLTSEPRQLQKKPKAPMSDKHVFINTNRNAAFLHATACA